MCSRASVQKHATHHVAASFITCEFPSIVRLNTGRVPVTTMPSPCRMQRAAQSMTVTVCPTPSLLGQLSPVEWCILTKASWYTLVHWTCLASLPARTMGRPSTSRYSCQNRTEELRDCLQTDNIRPRGERMCKQMGVAVYAERVSSTGETGNSELGSAVSEALDKPTWVLILIAQMERISK